jgi:hypothetical protein
MKIAVVIAGQWRTHSICYNSILEKVVKPYEADVFLCTDKIEDNHCTYKNYLKSLVVHGDIETEQTKKAHRIVCSYLYENRVSKRENKLYERIRDVDIFLKKHRFPQFVRLYSCKKAVEDYEKKADFQYDSIIKLRADNYFFKTPPLSSSNTDVLRYYDFVGIGKRKHMMRWLNIADTAFSGAANWQKEKVRIGHIEGKLFNNLGLGGANLIEMMNEDDKKLLWYARAAPNKNISPFEVIENQKKDYPNATVTVIRNKHPMSDLRMYPNFWEAKKIK